MDYSTQSYGLPKFHPTKNTISWPRLRGRRPSSLLMPISTIRYGCVDLEKLYEIKKKFIQNGLLYAKLWPSKVSPHKKHNLMAKASWTSSIFPVNANIYYKVWLRRSRKVI